MRASRPRGNRRAGGRRASSPPAHSAAARSASSSPLRRGGGWTESAAARPSSRAPAFRWEVAPGRPWSGTPHSLGPGGTLVLPTRPLEPRTPKRESGGSERDPVVSLRPGAVQRPPRGPTPSAESQSPAGEICFSARPGRSPLKCRHRRGVDVRFLWQPRRSARSSAPHWREASAHLPPPWPSGESQTPWLFRQPREKAY